MCPKHGFGHTYKVSAWNSHQKTIFAIHKFRDNFLESSRNVSETTPWCHIKVLWCCWSGDFPRQSAGAKNNHFKRNQCLIAFTRENTQHFYPEALKGSRYCRGWSCLNELRSAAAIRLLDLLVAVSLIFENCINLNPKHLQIKDLSMLQYEINQLFYHAFPMHFDVYGREMGLFVMTTNRWVSAKKT